MAFLASCGSSDRGELVGVQDRPTWYPNDPYGMVYIPQSFTMGNHMKMCRMHIRPLQKQ